MSSSKYYWLRSFMKPGCPISPSGSFRDNIRLFLQECAQPKDYQVGGMPIWCTFLVHEDRRFVIPLYIFEECVENSFQPLCDHCQYFGPGWINPHFVSKRNYHFIIPMVNDWQKLINNGVLDLKTHILHGMIHSNGFGHLLCINGIEGGSRLICGYDAMDLWDRICTTLQTRKISVVDTSKKRKMDLRLLYGVAHGKPWFGRWEYKTFIGVTNNKYEQALQLLSSLELDIAIKNKQHCYAKVMINRYRGLSDTQLVTIRDLFRFMLKLKSLMPKNKNHQDIHENDLYKDVAYLYQLVLLDSDVDNVRFAVRTVLNRNFFTKELPFKGGDDQFLRFICRIIPLEMGLENRKKSVGVQLLVPFGATICDFKVAAVNAMRDTYCVMENLEVKEIVGLEGLDEDEVIYGRFESGCEIFVRGSGVDLLMNDNESGLVMCECGAREDDGERMVTCCHCMVWQHTRCNGLNDAEDVP